MKFSILKQTKASALLSRVEKRGCLLLTNEFDCKEIRSDLATSRSEFDSIIEYLFQNKLITINQKNSTVWMTLTDTGKDKATSELTVA